MVATVAPSSRQHGWFTFVELAWFVTLLATALAMAAAIAHALALPNKMGMTQDDYFAAQLAYRGWSNLGFLLSVEATGLLAFAISQRRTRAIFWRICAAGAAFIASQVAFWLFTFPANLATENWTVVPSNWEQLRFQWEYSHLAGAACQVLVFSFVLLAVLRRPSLAVRPASTPRA